MLEAAALVLAVDAAGEAAGEADATAATPPRPLSAAARAEASRKGAPKRVKGVVVPRPSDTCEVGWGVAMKAGANIRVAGKDGEEKKGHLNATQVCREPQASNRILSEEKPARVSASPGLRIEAKGGEAPARTHGGGLDAGGHSRWWPR